jgi:hypothetical protein
MQRGDVHPHLAPGHDLNPRGLRSLLQPRVRLRLSRADLRGQHCRAAHQLRPTGIGAPTPGGGMTILDRLLPLLMRDFAFKEAGDWLRQGVCPQCGKKELYTNREHPYVLRCGRLNKCGTELHVKEIYPELFENWSRHYPATPQNPNAAADAYLATGRGFDIGKLKAWGVAYSQESWWDSARNEGSAVVRFPVTAEAAWERIIDQPERFGNRKASFRGQYGGAWWQAARMGDFPKNEIWIVEGIFDALALMHHGLYAVAAMSCNNYPARALSALKAECQAADKPRPTLIFALDNDMAGRGFIQKHMARAKNDGWPCACALIPQKSGKKLDWNDAHQRDHLSEKDIAEYRYQGNLFTAETPTAKAILMYAHDGHASFPFNFDHRIYWWKLDIEKLDKAIHDIEATGQETDAEKAREKALAQTGSLTEICNCQPSPLYYIKNDPTDEAWYYFRVDFPHDGPSVKNTFTAAQLSSATEFKKRILHIGPGAIWAGSSGQLDALLKRWTYHIKTVQTIDYVGYSIAHKTYVFNSVAVSNGRVIEKNDEDYFEVGKLSIKTLSRIDKMEINTDLKAQADWFDRFYLCFGPKGIIALAFWFGTLFAEQIRARFESFPFLEIVGEPGAGKTTLLETLWKLLGRNGYEGFDPMKASHVGFLRSMAQVANLPVVLIESDRDSDADGSRGRGPAMFHWDSLKSLYNGGSLRTTGVKSAGNDTYDPQFRAALVISQNAPVSASTPIMERIIHLMFDKSRQSEAGREAALELGRMNARDLSPFILAATTREETVLKRLEENHRQHEKMLEMEGVKNQRLQKNYAQVIALLDCLELATPITRSQREEAAALLVELALQRERDLMRDHPIVERFWEAFDYLNGTPEKNDADDSNVYEPRLNHSRDPALIAINLNHFIQVAADHRQQVPDLHDLKKYLKTSRARKFVAANTVVSSAINARYNADRSALSSNAPRPQSIRCWLFKTGAK